MTVVAARDQSQGTNFEALCNDLHVDSQSVISHINARTLQYTPSPYYHPDEVRRSFAAGGFRNRGNSKGKYSGEYASLVAQTIIREAGLELEIYPDASLIEEALTRDKMQSITSQLAKAGMQNLSAVHQMLMSPFADYVGSNRDKTKCPDPKLEEQAQQHYMATTGHPRIDTYPNGFPEYLRPEYLISGKELERAFDRYKNREAEPKFASQPKEKSSYLRSIIARMAPEVFTIPDKHDVALLLMHKLFKKDNLTLKINGQTLDQALESHSARDVYEAAYEASQALPKPPPVVSMQ